MTVRKVPTSMLASAATKEVAKTAQTSRVENTQLGKCPVCSNQMKESSVNNVRVHFCKEHNIVMPVKD